jgi:hypothetical protein
MSWESWRKFGFFIQFILWLPLVEWKHTDGGYFDTYINLAFMLSIMFFCSIISFFFSNTFLPDPVFFLHPILSNCNILLLLFRCADIRMVGSQF